MQRRLNNTQIENAGVDAVSDYFNFTETLDPSIPKRDKEPVWDGKLFLYKDGSDKQSKTGLIGFIPVQVKGRQFKDQSKTKISHKINVNDVRVYQKNGGVAFFVVYVNADTTKKKIYYRLLAPIDLRKIVRIAGNKKEIYIEFYELPERDKAIEFQFLDFYNDCFKQHSFSNQKPIQLNDIRDEIQSIDVQFSAPSGSEYEALKYLSKTPQFCYVTLKNDPTKTPHPVGEGRQPIKTEIIYDMPVKIGDKVYFDEVRCEFKKGVSYWVIANCLRVPFNNSPKDVNKTVKIPIPLNPKTLSQRIKYFTFLKAVQETGYFCIGDDTIVIDKIVSSKDDFFERMLKTDMEIQSIFDRLNVSDDLILTNISKQDVKNLNILMTQFVQNKPVSSSKSYDNQFELTRLDVNNIKLLFRPSRIEGTNDNRLISVHDLSNFYICTLNSKNDNIIRVPGFYMFSSDSYKEVCNISYESFIKECDLYKSDDKNYYKVINHSILRMIKAYDLQENKKQILIETALSLNQWLIDNDSDNDLSLIYKLNKLQILKRMQGLSEKENDFLYDTIDASNSNEEAKFVCHTLLENKEAATRCFRKLPQETQNYVKTLPIFNLFSSLGS